MTVTRWAAAIAGTAVTVLLAGGCAGVAAPGVGSPRAATPAAASPTAACPVQPGVELPENCAPYDPDAAMALNDAYRQRMPSSNESPAATAVLVDGVRARLDDARADGGWSEESVRALLEEAGLSDIQTRTGAGDVLFGAVPPGGGCVFGALEEQAVTVEAGGYILDGGCLPAQ